MIGDEPGDTDKDPDASEEAVPKSEGRAGLRFYLLYDKISGKRFGDGRRTIYANVMRTMNATSGGRNQ